MGIKGSQLATASVPTIAMKDSAAMLKAMNYTQMHVYGSYNGTKASGYYSLATIPTTLAARGYLAGRIYYGTSAAKNITEFMVYIDGTSATVASAKIVGAVASLRVSSGQLQISIPSGFNGIVAWDIVFEGAGITVNTTI